MAISKIQEYEIRKDTPYNWYECSYSVLSTDSIKNRCQYNAIYFVPIIVRKTITIDAIGGKDDDYSSYSSGNTIGLYSSDKNAIPNKLLSSGKAEDEDNTEKRYLKLNKHITLKPGIYWGADGIKQYRTSNYGYFSARMAVIPKLTIMSFSIGRVFNDDNTFYMNYGIDTAEGKLPETIEPDDIQFYDNYAPYMAVRVVG